jgi:predicted tellurium resistance membrane protein TerC
MNSLAVFSHITLADFRERARSYGYLGTLILTIIAAFIFVRLVDAGFVVMQFGRYRSIGNINYLWTAVVANESLLL